MFNNVLQAKPTYKIKLQILRPGVELIILYLFYTFFKRMQEKFHGKRDAGSYILLKRN